MSIIQQLEDLKEWSKDSTRYERRLAFRAGQGMGTEAGTIPIEWDELSDREIEYYRTGPWSTREDYSKGQLVQPGPGRQGYSGTTTYRTKTNKYKIDNQFGTVWTSKKPAGGKTGVRYTKKEVATIKKTLPKGIAMTKGPYGAWYYTLRFLTKKKGDTLQFSKVATPEHLDFLLNKQEGLIEQYYPNRLTDAKFEQLRMLDDNINLTREEFVKKLNKNKKTTVLGNEWTTDNIATAEKRTKINDLIPREGQPRTLGEASEIVRTRGLTGKDDIADVYKRLPGPKNKEARLKEIQRLAKTIVKVENRKARLGRFSPTKNRQGLLWRNYYEAMHKGTRIKMEGTFDGKSLKFRKNWPRNEKGQIDWSKIDPKTITASNPKGNAAWKSIKFKDTKVPDAANPGKFKTVSFTYDNLGTQVDEAFGKGFFTRATTPYVAQKELWGKTYKGKKIGEYVARANIIKHYQSQKGNAGKMPTEKYISQRMSAYAPAQVHHWGEEGVKGDPYRTQLTSRTANQAVNVAEQGYEARIRKAGNDPVKIAEAKKWFKNEIKNISKEHGGIKYTVDGKVVGGKTTPVSIYTTEGKTAGLKGKDFKSFKNALYKQFPDFVKKCGLKKAEGGRIGFATGTQSFDDCMRGAIADETRIAKGFGANAKKAMQRLGGVAKWAGKWIGLIDVPIEFAFALPALLRGDIEGAKRHTLIGLFGWGETQMEQMKETNPEAYKFLKHDNDVMNWQQAEWQLEHLNEAKERLEKSKLEGGYGSNELNKINTQIEELRANQTNIEENYIGYEYADEVALGKQMLGSYVKNEADRHREARDRGEVLGMQKPIVDEAFGELTPTSIMPEKERKAVDYPDTYGGYLMKKQFDKTEGRYREDPIIEALIEEGPYMEVDEWRKRYMPEKSAISPAQLNAMYGSGAIQDYYNTVQSAQGSPGFNYAGFAGGGIAGIRRPWAIPPESGPDPYGGGLSSQFNRVKKLTG